MTVISEIRCAHCDTVHRSTKTWQGGAVRYLYYCKRCGEAMHFGVGDLRWSFIPAGSGESTSCLTMPTPLEVRNLESVERTELRKLPALESVITGRVL